MSRSLPRFQDDESLPQGGSTGLDHAGTGTCRFHPAVMTTDGMPCPQCRSSKSSVPTVAVPPTPRAVRTEIPAEELPRPSLIHEGVIVDRPHGGHQDAAFSYV